MSSTRSIDPYTARYVTLGSGPRERAASCSCNYRTTSAKCSCYTGLCKDPPLVSHQRKMATEAMNRNNAPLVRMLMREPSKSHVDQVSRRTLRRPFSAATCTQMDGHQHPKTIFDGLISVKGKNMDCHARPMGKRASEMDIADKVIESISEATAKQVSKMSSFFSDPLPQSIPKPPCPSPVQSEESSGSQDESVSEQDGSGSEQDGSGSEQDGSGSEQDGSGSEQDGSGSEQDGSGSEQDGSGSEQGGSGSKQDRPESKQQLFSPTNTITILPEEDAGLKKTMLPREKDSTQILSGDFNAVSQVGQEAKVKESSKSWIEGNTSLRQPSGSNREVCFHRKQNTKRGSKTCLEFKIPTGGEGEESDPDDQSVFISEPNSCANEEKSSSEVTPQKARDGVRRPVSAYAVLGSTVKAKTIEFVDDKEISGAQLVLSNRTLETMLYMEYLRDKEKLTRERGNDANLTSHKELGKGAKRSSKIDAASKNVNIPVEMQITSKPPLAREALVSQNDSNAEKSSSWRTKLLRNTGDTAHCITSARPNTHSPSEKLAYMNDKRMALARKIIRKADVNLKTTKQQQKEEVSFIWRNITRIDNTSNKQISDKLTVELTEEREARPQKNLDVCEEERLNYSLPYEGSSLKGSKEDTNADNSIDATAQKLKRANLRINPDKHAVISAEERRPLSKNMSNFGERKILRPTSAVILRYMETQKDYGQKKVRPTSSTVKSKADKSPVDVKQRPRSAVVQRISARKLQCTGSKVIASKSLDLAVKNSENVKDKVRKNRSITPAPSKPAPAENKPVKQRPISAPIKTLQKANSVNVFDIAQEEKKISQECHNVLEAFSRKGIKMSMDTITRALMPPCERAKIYSKTNLPHSSRLLSKPSHWFAE